MLALPFLFPRGSVSFFPLSSFLLQFSFSLSLSLSLSLSREREHSAELKTRRRERAKVKGEENFLSFSLSFFLLPLSSLLPRRRPSSLLLLVKLPVHLLLLYLRHRRVKSLLGRSLLGRRVSDFGTTGGLGSRRRRRVSDRGQVGQVRVQPRLEGRGGVELPGAIGLRDRADEAIVVLEELRGKGERERGKRGKRGRG